MTRQLMQEYYVRPIEETGRMTLSVTAELEEAIFLADRLVVLTNRPSRVKGFDHAPGKRLHTSGKNLP